MREPFDETILTAYALGELGEAERADVEARLSESPELRGELQEIRETADALRAALAVPANDTLTAAQRTAVEHTAAARPRRWTRQRSVLAGLAAAASLVLGTLVYVTRSGAPAPVVYAPFGESRPEPQGGPATIGSATVEPATVEPATVEPVTLTPPLQGRADSEILGGVMGGTRVEANTLERQYAFFDETLVESSRQRPNLKKEEAERLRALGYLAPSDDDSDNGVRKQSAPFVTDAYDHIRDNPFVLVSQDPRSTFSVDVDTASYSIVRRHLDGGSLPPKDAVRIEELVNYFRYDYAPPTGPHPFAVHLDAVRCPWKAENRLVRIGLKGRELPRGERPPGNLVFLLDVSGSMDEPTKLPLVKQAMKLLVGELTPRDRVAIVVYAGAEGLVLRSTPATEKQRILAALDRLSAGGTTHGSAGLKLAYETAQASFIEGGINRVILATDGDFNVGLTNQGDLTRLVEEKAKGGVFLTTLGFGMGNLKDSTLEKLADRGNGNYAYIDTLWEARKVLVEQIGGTLVTIAKDVKLQLEWNPAAVKAFRLIGYENRVLAHQDFNDDKKDAGDIGAGHTVTALYEVVPAGGDLQVPGVDPLKYQEAPKPTREASRNELLTLKLRYKQPDGETSTLLEETLNDGNVTFDEADIDLRFAASVASFGMLLRDSPFKGDAQYERTLAWAKGSLGADKDSLRAEFVTLVEKARRLRE